VFKINLEYKAAICTVCTANEENKKVIKKRRKRQETCTKRLKTSVADLDPMNDPQKYKKNNKYHFLKCSMFSFDG
jgi:hypothetical protein